MTEDMITMEDMALVYEVTDALGIDREVLQVELTKEGSGSVRLERGGLGQGGAEVVAVTLPAEVPLVEWLPELGAALDRLGVVKTTREERDGDERDDAR